jgi:hypothetical protein
MKEIKWMKKEDDAALRKLSDSSTGLALGLPSF